MALADVEIDFEFFGSEQEHPTLVCASILENRVTHNFWLLDNPTEHQNLVKFINGRKLKTWGSFGAVSEARCFLALGLDPTEFKWVDYHFEWKCLLNHNDDMEWGKQLIDGKEKVTKKPSPKWQRKKGEKEKGQSSPAEKNLAAAVYKLLDVIIDTDEKTRMRNIIISRRKKLIQVYRQQIQDYCASDVAYLPRLGEKMWLVYNTLVTSGDPKDRRTLKQDMLVRGEYAAHTACIEQTGYPVSIPAMRKFSDSVSSILFECQRDINSQFDFKPFRLDRKTGVFSWKKKATQEFIKTEYPDFIKDWELTDGKELSLGLEAFTAFFDFKHNYPRGNFGAQIVRYLKLRQSLNGFIPKSTNTSSDDKTIWDYTGADGRVRPYTNPYGAQSSRNQPSTRSFLFLKAAWLRVLCVPPEGKMMTGADWSSQEFLIGALISGDKNMTRAYHSGDPYMWFGKAAKKIPENGTRETHGLLRDRFKSSVLGIMYLMGAASLARKITNDTGVFCSEAEAQKFIDIFDSVFYDFAQWRDDVIEFYRLDSYIRLQDGWFMWGNNPNFRSVVNVGIQGTGAVVLRNAVRLAKARGLKVCMTLHDALYPIANLGDWSQLDVLSGVMKESFAMAFSQHKESDKIIRSDFVAWSPELRADVKSIVTPKGLKVETKQLYVDKRSLDDYTRFKGYLVEGADALAML